MSDSPDRLYALEERPGWPGLEDELTPQQELACAFRILAEAGCNLDLAGHITWVADDAGSMWTNPWGLWWEEVRASDILRVDADGTLLEGRWPVNPAIFVHTEIHRRRGARGRVAVHNHPYYGVLLGTLDVVPQVTDQQSTMFVDDVTLYDEYNGGVTNLDEGVAFADGVGEKSAALLRNHGCLVTAPNIRQAVYKTVMLERMCRLNYDALVAGIKPIPVPDESQRVMRNVMLRYSSHVFWEGAVRQLLAREPEVLT
jgi:ribulose-5-phosphate 4-epimerase/fuculose-1-phosphate aldolase